MYSRGSGTCCAVRGCFNNQRKLNLWLQERCLEHAPRTKKECGCERRYSFYRLPREEEPQRTWLKNLNLKKPPQTLYVCSFHFVDKKPTEENPHPTLWLGYEKPPERRRRVLSDRSPTTTVTLSVFEEKTPPDQWITSSGMNQEGQLYKDAKETEVCVGHAHVFAPVSEDSCHSVQPSLNRQMKEEGSDSESPPDSKRLSCLFCAAEFTTGGLLTMHTSGHTGTKLLTCVVCKKTFKSESELVHHVCESRQHPPSQAEEQIPADRPFHCPQCGETFSTSDNLNLHLRVHSRGKPFSCSVCGASCSDRDSLVHHMRRHTTQTQFTCHVCGKDFAWRRHLTKHMEVHGKRKKVFRCRACGAEFHTYYLLSKHKVVHEMSEFPQDRTEKDKEEGTAGGEDAGGGGDPANTNSDLLEETNMKDLPSFKTENNIWTDHSHLPADVTPKGLDNISETDRNTTFKTKIKKQVKEEDSEPPQIKEEEEETEISGFTFSPVPMKTEENEEKPQVFQLRLLQTEEPLKEGDGGTAERTGEFSDHDTDDSKCWKPGSGSNSESDTGRNLSESLQAGSDDSVDSDFWKDDKKPKASSNPAKPEASEKGVKYVIDVKPYSCPQCGKAYRLSSYLKMHMKQHTERYSCSVCGHKSTSNWNLKIHVRTHTGEKPFGCSVCSKRYTNKASMLSHMSVHDAERKYNCDSCKKSFAWYTELKYHQCGGESSGEQTQQQDASINLKRHTLHS